MRCFRRFFLQPDLRDSVHCTLRPCVFMCQRVETCAGTTGTRRIGPGRGRERVAQTQLARDWYTRIVYVCCTNRPIRLCASGIQSRTYTVAISFCSKVHAAYPLIVCKRHRRAFANVCVCVCVWLPQGIPLSQVASTFHGQTICAALVFVLRQPLCKSSDMCQPAYAFYMTGFFPLYPHGFFVDGCVIGKSITEDVTSDPPPEWGSTKSHDKRATEAASVKRNIDNDLCI